MPRCPPVDRRFNRAHHDSHRALKVYRAALREQDSLTGVGVDLLAVIRDALKPASVELWLPPGPATPARPSHHREGHR